MGECCALSETAAAPVVASDGQAHSAKVAVAWVLDLADEQGRMVGRHAPRPVSRERVGTPRLSRGVAAWATLTVQVGYRMPQAAHLPNGYLGWAIAAVPVGDHARRWGNRPM